MKMLVRIFACFSGLIIYLNGVNCFMMCGLTRYDPRQELCCGSKVHDLVKNGKPTACCRKEEVYDPDEKVCCGHNLVPKNRLTNHICCNSKFVKRTSPNMHCCTNNQHEYGGITYDATSHICCLDDGRTQGDILRPSVHHIPNNMSKPACCGGVVFDETQSACRKDGTLMDLNDPLDNCTNATHSVQYDTRTQLCCDTGVVKNIPVFTTSQLEVPPSFVCRNNKVFDASFIRLVGDQQLSTGIEQCGDVFYLPQGSYGRVHCCDGQLKRSGHSEKNVQCCGQHLFDQDSQTCCSGRILDKSSGYDCCNKEKYHTGTHSCCNGQLINSSSHLCCQRTSTIFRIAQRQSANHTDCCGTATYNSFDSKCRRTQNGTTVVLPRSKVLQVLDKLTKMGANVGINDGNKTRSADRSCPFGTCGMKPMNKDESCNKRNGFKVFVYKIRENNKGTRIKAYLVESKRGKVQTRKVLLLTSHKCQCFLKDNAYWVYTNRSWKGGKKLKFREGDFFIHEESTFSCTTGSQSKRARRPSS